MTITSREILSRVAGEFGMTAADLTRNHSRDPHIQAARTVAMTAIRDELRLSYPAIGRIFGVGHSTVMYHINKARAGMKIAARDGEANV